MIVKLETCIPMIVIRLRKSKGQHYRQAHFSNLTHFVDFGFPVTNIWISLLLCLSQGANKVIKLSISLSAWWL